jgi:hypothetical protein
VANRGCAHFGLGNVAAVQNTAPFGGRQIALGGRGRMSEKPMTVTEMARMGGSPQRRPTARPSFGSGASGAAGKA